MSLTDMCDFFYHNGTDHPNCPDNINGAPGEQRPITTPINLFPIRKLQGKDECKEKLKEQGETV